MKLIWIDNERRIEATDSQASLVISSIDRDPWTDISNFIDEHRGDYIFGYIGFDIHRFKNEQLASASYPAVHLFVPQTVTETKLDSTDTMSVTLDGDPFQEQGRADYQKSVEDILHWIDGDQDKRITVARKVLLDDGLDLMSGLVGNLTNDVNRRFYAQFDDLEMMGNSPELLAKGTVRQFETYKLSGTQSKPAKVFDLLTDYKIRSEHESSRKRQRESLESIGSVTASNIKVLELENLFHLLSILSTEPNKGSSIVDCLRAIFPSGVYPYYEGMARLVANELSGRGAYYGLIGFIDQTGHFEFSQVLRTIFKQKDEAFCWVGAAITRDSNPQDEFKETSVKLNNMPKIDYDT